MFLEVEGDLRYVREDFWEYNKIFKLNLESIQIIDTLEDNKKDILSIRVILAQDNIIVYLKNNEAKKVLEALQMYTALMQSPNILKD